jgi:hypothetical protein
MACYAHKGIDANRGMISGWYQQVWNLFVFRIDAAVELLPARKGYGFYFLEIRDWNSADFGVGCIVALLAFVRTVIDDPTLLDGKFFAYKISCLGYIFCLIGRAEYGFKIHNLSPEKLSRAANSPAKMCEYRPAILRTNKILSR